MFRLFGNCSAFALLLSEMQIPIDSQMIEIISITGMDSKLTTANIFYNVFFKDIDLNYFGSILFQRTAYKCAKTIAFSLSKVFLCIFNHFAILRDKVSLHAYCLSIFWFQNFILVFYFFSNKQKVDRRQQGCRALNVYCLFFSYFDVQ